MEENPAYETKTLLQRQAYENTSEPGYEIIPAVSSLQSTCTHEHTTAQHKERYIDEYNDWFRVENYTHQCKMNQSRKGNATTTCWTATYT